MNTKTTKTVLSNLQIETVRKNIKNIHLGVYPPDGRVRVSVPLKTNEEALRLFLISKIAWIKKQQRAFSQQKRQTKRGYVSGENHYFFGRRFKLTVNYSKTEHKIKISKSHIVLYVKPKTTIKQKEEMFEKFYRSELEKTIPKLLKKWEKKVGVKVNEAKIRKMKTKWGACNSNDKCIWLNLELAKKPLHCIDYVFVHELVHLIEKRHSAKFIQILESAYPNWQDVKDELNQGILGYFEWGCKPNPKLKNLIETRF